jgi:hypothetical protein
VEESLISKDVAKTRVGDLLITEVRREQIPHDDALSSSTGSGSFSPSSSWRIRAAASLTSFRLNSWTTSESALSRRP